jgi:uncharacterized protein (UPF0332 family)
VDEQARRWQQTGWTTLDTAKHLHQRDDHRSCVSRAYYAAYQVATAACLAHGDKAQFPHGWNNPSHEQLPDLIANNGDLPASNRKQLKKLLRLLRSSREDADYRPGQTVDERTAKTAILFAHSIFELLEIDDDRNH